MRAALLGLFLSWPAAAQALPWYCDDEQLAQEVLTALDAYWVDHPVVVRVGLPREGTAIYYDEGQLHLRDDERFLSRRAPRDAPTLVLLARSWTRELEATGETGWTPRIDLPLPPPEPPPPPPPPEPRPLGYAWDLGLGIRDAATEPSPVEGTHLLARVFAGRASFEAGLYLAGAGTQRVYGLERSLLQVFDDAKEDTGVELVRDTNAFSTLMALGPDPLRREEALSGGPWVAFGLEARRYSVFTAVVDPDADEVYIQSDARHGWALGPTLGAGLELWLGGRLGLRVGATDRMAWPLARDRTFSEGLRHDPTLTVDLLLGGV